jgi:short-subunit dehydrogenase
MQPLSGFAAVVTGASSGIGRAISLGLAKRGVNLYLISRRPEMLKVTASIIQEHGVKVCSRMADFSKDDDLRLLATNLGQLEHIDILIHSAGIFTMGRVESTSVENLDQQYRVNVRAPYLLTQALLPKLRISQGQIVFINSTLGFNARASVSQYAASKHALKALADGLRDEVNAEGIRVLSVYPGRTASPMQAVVHEMEGRAYHPERLMQPDDVADTVINTLVLPRTAEVTDIYIRPLNKLL